MSLTLEIVVTRLIVCLVVVFLFIGSFSSFSQNKTIEQTGDVFLFLLPAATVTTTLLKKDNKGTWQYSKGVLLAGAITYGLKFGIQKMRPDMSNENSFPSGHTSMSFQSAAFIHRRYGFIESLPFYAIAGFTSFSRINADKHDGWDLLAGAFIGIGSSFIFTSPLQENNIKLSFSSSKESFLISFSYQF
ncbi:MAG: phosphatase PAP2 family protein [Flavobacteriaceae bacterium]|nr:phosphatase PAP2 family protein [Flavobacteriaceae bacterium]